MKTVGLITEYNPFHNGHQYHIEQAKKITGADRVIVIMSGDFVQRGQPAIMPKHLRAEMALRCGASAVFELPVCYATGSAEVFATGAVSFLEMLGCVDVLCFGSECADMDTLEQIARILSDETDEYVESLRSNLQKGLSYPAARVSALSQYCCDDSFSEILRHPNNILGIEYLKVLYKTNSAITPCTIRRDGGEYHDKELREIRSSASAIRATLQQSSFECLPFSEQSVLAGHIPENCCDLLNNAYKKTYPVYTDTFSLILKYALLQEEDFSHYQDVSAELSNRIIKLRNQFQSFEQFCELLKTKDLTYTRISRALTHIMLHITTCDTEHHLNDQIHYYAHLLGFKKDESDILTEIKKTSRLPILSKLSDASFSCEEAEKMLRTDCFASDLFYSVLTELYKTPFLNEYQKQLIRI